MAGEQILIVDDNAINVRLVRFLLASKGYEVRTAEDAGQALRQLQTAVPRLILMDVQLPGTDGLTLTRQLRTDPRLAGVVIVALTADAMAGAREKAMAAGCDGYITKPIDTRSLPGQVAAYLERPAGR